MAAAKRHRPETAPPEWWARVLGWVRSDGGQVHQSLSFSESRELLVEGPIAKDTVLLEIPLRRLVTMASALAEMPYLDKTLDAVKKYGKDTKIKNDDSRIPDEDIVLALYLACISAKDLPYHETLPDASTFDSLPRRWDQKDMENLLGGSPLYHRVQASRKSVQSIFDTAKESWPTEIDCPSFDRFSVMLAAVSSRAFGIKDQENGSEFTAMVPILDLCNHTRGLNAKKNISYSYTKDAKLQVKAIEDIDAGSPLSITYGAQGNGQLLLNYGFCIPNNVEPDGSSNDVYEFLPSPEESIIGLRIGPKSYTYGSFVKALEYFTQKHLSLSDEPRGMLNEEGDGPDGEGDDDMEAFLNACDEEGEGEEEFFGGEDDDEDDGGMIGPSKETVIKAEKAGLVSFKSRLIEEKGAYRLSGSDLAEALVHETASNSPRRHYAACLINSELVTIDFYLSAISKVEEMMSTESKPPLNGSDRCQTAQFVDQLASAFMKIRHGDLL